MLFKEGVNPKDLEQLKPAAWILLCNAILYCEEMGLDLIITSLISDRKKLTSESTTHEDGRAFDISTWRWSPVQVQRFLYKFNADYSDIGAISSSDGKPKAAVYHNFKNLGEHLHLQVKPNAKWHRFITRS